MYNRKPKTESEFDRAFKAAQQDMGRLSDAEVYAQFQRSIIELVWRGEEVAEVAAAGSGFAVAPDQWTIEAVGACITRHPAQRIRQHQSVSSKKKKKSSHSEPTCSIARRRTKKAAPRIASTSKGCECGKRFEGYRAGQRDSRIAVGTSSVQKLGNE